MSKVEKKTSFIRRLKSPLSLFMFAIFFVGALSVNVPKIVHAVSCDSAADCQAQINNLNNQNSQASQSVSNLESQAQSYQGTIDSLSSQIAGLQQQINDNEAKQAALEQEITSDQQQITDKKSILSDDVKTMYVDGQMTTLEELATSKNLSDFVDKQQYQAVVQNQLSAIIQQISALEQSLKSQKTQVDQLVTTEQTQNTQLSSAENQQQQLLGYNQSQQAAYNQQIATDASNVSALTAQLIALNNAGSTSASGTCGGGYPHLQLVA